MKDIHKKLMQECLEDAAELVDDFNQDVGRQFDEEMFVGQENVSKMALMLYKTRTQERNMKMLSNSGSVQEAEETGRMFG